MLEKLLRARHENDREPFDPGLELIARARTPQAAADPALRARAAEHLAAHPEDMEAVLLLDAFEAEQEPRQLFTWILPIGSMLAIAASISLVFLVLDRPEEELAVKGSGDYALELAVERGGRRFVLEPSGELLPDDRVGFFYSAPRAGHLAIVHRDEAGQAAIMFPAGAGAGVSAQIFQGREVALPDVALIERGSGCEWFVAIFSESPLALADLLARVSSAPVGAECRLEVRIVGASSIHVLPVRVGVK
jgi:hypothetical protein